MKPLSTLRSLAAVAATCSLISNVACGGAGETIDQHPCPQGGTTLTYDNFGKAFLDGWCQSCHGSNSDNRNGAPGSYTFDTRDQAFKWRARIFARAADDNSSMPLGPHGPSSEDRKKLGDWLACGAP